MSFVGDIVGGLIGADSAEDATAAQTYSAEMANQLQRYMYDTTRKDARPYRQAGRDALGQIQQLLKDPNSITQQPGYQFGLDQGVNALENSASARGMQYSGQQAKALQQFGNDYAGSKLNETYNRLSNIAGLGQVGVNQSATAGMNYANNAGNNMIGAGNAQAAGALARGSAYGNALNSTLAYGDRNGWFGGGNALQSAFSQTALGGSGFGSGLAYGNQDLGQFI